MLANKNLILKCFPICLSLLMIVMQIQSKKTLNSKTVKDIESSHPNGTVHTFMLNKYQVSQQFSFKVSCKEPAIIDFQLSNRLKRLHKYIFLNAQFEANECIQTKQDTARINVNDEKWELELHHVCCGKKNQTKVFNQTIKVVVRDGFKFFGVSIKTKIWNIAIPVLTSICICIFVWFSNFSQPRPRNVPFLARFYKDPLAQQKSAPSNFSKNNMQELTKNNAQ